MAVPTGKRVRELGVVATTAGGVLPALGFWLLVTGNEEAIIETVRDSMIVTVKLLSAPRYVEPTSSFLRTGTGVQNVPQETFCVGEGGSPLSSDL